jgi:hypothetical protein
VTYTGGSNFFTISAAQQTWPSAVSNGDDVTLYWDLKRTDGGDQVCFFGDFVVHAGAAQP